MMANEKEVDPPRKRALSASYVKLCASPSRVIQCPSISVPTIGPDDNEETQEERKLLVFVRYLVQSVFGADCINNALVQEEVDAIPSYNSALPRWFLSELMHWIKVVYDDLESFPMDKDLEYYRSPNFWEFVLQQFEAVETQNSRYESERNAWILAFRTVLEKKTNKHGTIDLHRKSGTGDSMVDYDNITEKIKGLIDRDESCRGGSDRDTTESDLDQDDKDAVSAMLVLGSSKPKVRRTSQRPQHQRPAKKRKIRDNTATDTSSSPSNGVVNL